MGYTTQNALALWCECQYVWKQWWNKTDAEKGYIQDYHIRNNN